MIGEGRPKLEKAQKRMANAEQGGAASDDNDDNDDPQMAYRLTTALADRITEGGAIVNIASRAYLGNFGQFNYSMSKGGVVGLTRAMALSLAPHVRVNAVAPGLIDTEMIAGVPDFIVNQIPMPRVGRPEEVAALVSFLASDEAGYITGQSIGIDGGF